MLFNILIFFKLQAVSVAQPMAKIKNIGLSAKRKIHQSFFSSCLPFSTTSYPICLSWRRKGCSGCPRIPFCLLWKKQQPQFHLCPGTKPISLCLQYLLNLRGIPKGPHLSQMHGWDWSPCVLTREEMAGRKEEGWDQNSCIQLKSPCGTIFLTFVSWGKTEGSNADPFWDKVPFPQGYEFNSCYHCGISSLVCAFLDKLE